MMKYYWLFMSWGSLCLLSACDAGHGRQVEAALLLAGKNRIELQKVLEHYKEDEEKYRATCFLIENMPFYGFYEGKALENYHKYYEILSDTLCNAQIVADSLEKADGPFSLSQLTYKRDIETVDSAFLVNHIEWAFKVRREQPWGKNVSFDDFCEYILPYRIGDEPLSAWREELYNRYNPMQHIHITDYQ